MKVAISTNLSRQQELDEQYDKFEQVIKERVANAKGPLFTTDATNLFQIYLDNLPVNRRQHYNCRCCQQFIEKYGGLVKVNEYGNISPLLWYTENIPPFFCVASSALWATVLVSKITGVFVSKEKVWGTPHTQTKTFVNWTHLSGVPDKSLVYQGIVLNADQKAAELVQDYAMLQRALAEVSIDAIKMAISVLKSDSLSRSEKALSAAEWLLVIKDKLQNTNKSLRNNVVWDAVAKAPPGFCHVRTNMISTLLKDIEDGYAFNDIKARWDKKMHPLQYMRPSAPPKDGNIAQAEKILETLKSAGALDRRYARFDEITCFWTPNVYKEKSTPAKSVFGHLKGQKKAPLNVVLPQRTMTWSKFFYEELSGVETLELSVSYYTMTFAALVTAVNPDAPPIIQWDGLENYPRNPVSHYTYSEPSLSSNWNLKSGWVKVNGICRMPYHWQDQDKFADKARGMFLILEDCRDKRWANVGNALFPEIMKNEYHGIRATIEAYSRNAKLSGYNESSACGLMVMKQNMNPFIIRANGNEFKIDRWD